MKTVKNILIFIILLFIVASILLFSIVMLIGSFASKYLNMESKDLWKVNTKLSDFGNNLVDKFR